MTVQLGQDAELKEIGRHVQQEAHFFSQQRHDSRYHVTGEHMKLGHGLRGAAARHLGLHESDIGVTEKHQFGGAGTRE